MKYMIRFSRHNAKLKKARFIKICVITYHVYNSKKDIFYGNDWQMLDVKVGTNIIAVSDHEF